MPNLLHSAKTDSIEQPDSNTKTLEPSRQTRVINGRLCVQRADGGWVGID